uniref:Putative secreted protein n=2 Tax=Ixodes ricinus TaxID=34613 RepID=V5GJA0_IXORI
MIVRIWYGIVTVIFLCTFSAQWGACDAQTCESALLTSCFPPGEAKVPKVEFTIRDVTVDSLKKDCTNADAISTCVNNLKIDGCQDEERRHLQLLKDGLRSTRNSLCHEDLYQSVVEFNRCRNETVFDVCNGAYNDERTILEEGGHLTREERECRYGEYACYLKSAEGCPSTSLAREAVNDYYNSNLDLNSCARFDGSSGQQRCDAERFLVCFTTAVGQIRFPKDHDDKSLANDCKVAESVDSCTKYMEIGGCSDEMKQRLQYLKRDFASLHSQICDPNIHTSVLELTQCMNESAVESCTKLLPQHHCRIGEYDCFLNATTKCTRDSPAIKAMHHLFNTHHDLKNCSRVNWNDGNSGITMSPKILLTLAALCISLFPLRK